MLEQNHVWKGDYEKTMQLQALSVFIFRQHCLLMGSAIITWLTKICSHGSVKLQHKQWQHFLCWDCIDDVNTLVYHKQYSSILNIPYSSLVL